MAENGESTPTLFVQDDTGDGYKEYTPPDPPSFHETLPEDLRDSEHLKEVEDADKLARYYVDLKSNYLKPPDTADGYEFEKPEDFELDTEMFSKFKEIAFENGINQKGFSDIMNMEVGRKSVELEKISDSIKNGNLEFLEPLKGILAQHGRGLNIVEADGAKSESELKTEWGDQYEKKLESAKGFLRNEHVASESFNKFLEDTRFGDNPEVIRMFAKLADLISEDAFIKPGKGDSQQGPLRDEAGRPMLSFPSMEE